MKITLLSEDAIRLEPIPGPMTIEAISAEQSYSAFHMLASALAYCTFSVLYSWATTTGIDADDLVLEVKWDFADDPHRVRGMDLSFRWPSLPDKKLNAAKRVAELCTVHATLMHPPEVRIAGTAAKPAAEATATAHTTRPAPEARA